MISSIGVSPGVAKRLEKVQDQVVADVMQTDCVVAHPDTPTWELIRLMIRHGSPIPVVEDETGKLEGLVSSQSMLKELQNVLEDIRNEKNNAA